MPQWAGSCWYYLRFINPQNDLALVGRELESYWMPVDLYVGGAEHAVLHLLYARFWHKVLFDIGVVSTKEPFQKLVSQGMILGEVEYTALRDASGATISADDSVRSGAATVVKLSAEDVVKKGDGCAMSARDAATAPLTASSPPRYVLKADPSVRVAARAHKMSKSRGNVVNPDDVVKAYGTRARSAPPHVRLTSLLAGADSLRLYEMFMGPLRETKVWSTRSVDGVHRFLGRAWRLFEAHAGAGASVSDAAPSAEQMRTLHATIKRVTGASRLALAARLFAAEHLRTRRGHGRDALQHGHLGNDGVRKCGHQMGDCSPPAPGALRPAARPLRTAHRRGAVEPAGSRRYAGLRALAAV